MKLAPEILGAIERDLDEHGSLTKQRDVTFIREAMFLYSFLQDRGYWMPAVTAIPENVNAVSNETRELIFNYQIRFVLEEELDDFKEMD